MQELRRTIGAFLALALAAGPGDCQQLLFTPTDTLVPANGTTPSGNVLLGEVTGDGLSDIVYSEGSPTSKVTVLAQVPGTGFVPLRPSALPGLNVVLALADLDGDGDNDLVATGTSTFPNVIVVSLNNGAGSFGPPTETVAFSTSGKVRAVAADMNGDGVIDIACTTPYLQVLRGVGDGSFTLAQTYNNPGGLIVGLAVGDVDEDGRRDLLVSMVDGTTRIHRGLPGGNQDFTPVIVAMSNGATSSRGVAVEDFDGDGHLDLAVADVSLSRVGVRLGNGDGTFSGLFAGATDVDVPNGITTGDVNGDSVPDALVRRAGNFVSSTQVILGNSDGTFGSGGGPASALTGPLPVVVDADFDGRRDLVCFEKTGCAVMRNVTPLPGEPWENLGGSLYAGYGYPVLIGSGPLLLGEPWSLLVGNGRPGARPFVVVGFSALGAPFKGGTLWPVPDMILAWPTFGAERSSELAGLWPASASGLELWLQAWFSDNAAIQDYGASNAVRMSAP